MLFNRNSADNTTKNAQDLTSDSSPEKTPSGLASITLRDVVEALALALLVAIILRVFCIEMFMIPSHSMENTLKAGDFIIVNKLSYSFGLPRILPFTNRILPFDLRFWHSNIQHGDVVVFDYPGERDEILPSHPDRYIKRAIACPGDTLRMSLDEVFINGERVALPDLAKTRGAGYHRSEISAALYPFFFGNPSNFISVILPARGAKIKFDHTTIDRWKNFIERENNIVSVKNRIVFINGDPSTEYTVKDNYYFMLGDNRGNSHDSRFWGLVGERAILGKAWVIYWSEGAKEDDAGTQGIRWNRIGTWIR